ncbi:hypothetical protein N0V88_001350 [Collariella sp. IMI 366227]|nr:hypothetical protein N0V88_001350 [Collariella sp. IMI 366227]
MLPPLRTALTRGNFYKTFTRPVAKCALLAVFVYQLVYFGWSRLETDEIKEERQTEINKLEAQARGLQAKQAAAAAAAKAAEAGSGSGGDEGKGGSEKGKGGSWWSWK